MDDIRTQTLPIVDEDYIVYELKKRGLSYEDASKKKDKLLKETERLLQIHTVHNATVIQRNEQRREQGERRVEPDEALLLLQKCQKHSGHLTRER
eukprot:6097398-Amphidinium_carterae.1